MLHMEKIECQLCGDEMINKEELLKHQTINHESKQLECSHLGCGQMFATVDSLSDHNKPTIEEGLDHQE